MRMVAEAEQTASRIPLTETDLTQVRQWSVLNSPPQSPGRRNSQPSTSSTPGEQLMLF
jgi:hypothetical protein